MASASAVLKGSSLHGSADSVSIWIPRWASGVYGSDTRPARPLTAMQGNPMNCYAARLCCALGLGVLWTLAAQAEESTLLDVTPRLATVVPPLDSDVHNSTAKGERTELPIADPPYYQHERGTVDNNVISGLSAPEPANHLPGVPAVITTPLAEQDGTVWVGTEDGLYFRSAGTTGEFARHPTYGIEGPLSNVITGIAVDGHGTLWVTTPAGLSARAESGKWQVYRGREGLPWDELTAIAIDERDRIWLGSTRGLIQYRPYEEGRQWYYRAGERYLPGDHVHAVFIVNDGSTIYAQTDMGWGRIDDVPRTMFEKAELLESRYQERHRRLGMPSPARFENAYTLENGHLGTQPSDGLWTSYHVAAMSMAYSLTGEDRYREAAKEGMEALYLLQNVTGIKGLVARTMASVDEPAAKEAEGADNWHEAPGGQYVWRDDVSSDQIDGHYFGFYTYYEHIAQFDAEEKARIQKQIRQVTDYIIDNGYTIPDWDGEKTLWGWYDPVSLNEKPIHYLESGLYSLMILSHLKVAHYITGDSKYEDEYKRLIEEHGYLSNLLLEKKLFPDELNHSDDQLSAIAFYTILQLEEDPFIKSALHRAVRRHALIEVAERDTLFAFVYASVAPDDADVDGSIETIRDMPLDRRNWRMDNSHRLDVVVQPQANRGDAVVLRDVLPTDERDFERWNSDPFRADTGGDGRTEGSGEHYLLAYWLGRYHGLIGAPSR